MKNFYSQKDETVIKLILNTQSSSDWGKKKRRPYIPSKSSFVYTKVGGYGKKDECIKKALKIINNSKPGKIGYSMERDSKNIPVVHFNIKTPSHKHLQISFHTYCKEVKEGSKKKKGANYRWQKKKSARGNCYRLERLLLEK